MLLIKIKNIMHFINLNYFLWNIFNYFFNNQEYNRRTFIYFDLGNWYQCQKKWPFIKPLHQMPVLSLKIPKFFFYTKRVKFMLITINILQNKVRYKLMFLQNSKITYKLGALNIQTYESLIQSWNLISPSVVSAVKLGKMSPSCTILMS